MKEKIIDILKDLDTENVNDTRHIFKYYDSLTIINILKDWDTNYSDSSSDDSSEDE